MPPQIIPIQGRWGRLLFNAVEMAEATEIEWEASIEQLEVLQAGGYWKSWVEGSLEGSGNMTVYKTSSRFEDYMIRYMSATSAEIKAARSTTNPMRPPFTLQVQLNDPHILSTTNIETVTLDYCRLWNLQGGYSRGGLLQRRYRFTFEGLSLDSKIPLPVPAPVVVPAP